MLNKLFEGLLTVVTYVLITVAVFMFTLWITIGGMLVVGDVRNFIETQILTKNYEERMLDNCTAISDALETLDNRIDISQQVDIINEAHDETDPLLIKYIMHPYLMK